MGWQQEERTSIRQYLKGLGQISFHELSSMVLKGVWSRVLLSKGGDGDQAIIQKPDSLGILHQEVWLGSEFTITAFEKSSQLCP